MPNQHVVGVVEVSPNAAGSYVVAPRTLKTARCWHIGMCLYNPATHTRSVIKFCAMQNHGNGYTHRQVRVFV